MALDENDRKVLSDLRKKRGVVKASLTRIRTFVQNFRPAVDAITLLEFRQEQLPEVNRKFDDVQSQIELIDIDNAEEIDRERAEFENDYFAIRSEMQELINAEKSQNSSIQNNSMNSMPLHRARLAPLSLPKFDGNIQEWESYFDCFKSMVHNEDAYPPAQKFSYLRSSLSGAALDIIKAIPMTENNYNVAIKRLQQRFENRSMVIQSHIRAILDFPQVQSAVANDLQALHSNIVAHVAALEALGQPVEMWDAWLVTVLLRKVDHGTCHEWQIRRTNNELPRYKELEEFLASRCIAFENSETWDNSNTGTKKKWTNSHTGKRLALAATEVKTDKCPCCNLMHKLYHCERFKELPQGDRFNIVRNARMCFNCLSPYHMVPACQSKSVCQRCKNKHNTLLHYERFSKGDASRQYPNDEEDPRTSSTPPDKPQSVHSCLAAKPTDTHVFLSTAIVQVTDSRGFNRDARAVLDSGSMVNFISRNLLNVLQLNTQKTRLPIQGVGASQVQSVAKVEIRVNSKITNYKIILSCFVLPTVVSELPACNASVKNWNIPSELRCKLADPKFDKAGSVDLLIGAGIFYELLEAERVSLGIGNLSLQDTKLGWIVTGGLEVTCLLGINSLGETMENDWKPVLADEEQYGKGSKANQRCEEEEETLRHFQKSVRRSEDGRFVLRLPTKSEIQNLGDSLAMATSRFINIERRLQRDEQLRLEYVKFMKEYLDMGHMQEVTTEEELLKKAYYLPHHPVLKSSSLTTKTRVVFDGSARTTSGLALNDVLMRGPTVQEDIFSILVRFRKHQYVITADIEKMFRQIMVTPEDCHLQRILWRANPSEMLRTYNLLTITYGTTPASFMATQCLVTLAEEIQKENPKVAEVINRDFYMDDLMTGCDTVEECMQLQGQITGILQSAKLPLRKWCSNSHLIIENISGNQKDPFFALNLGDEDTVKSLGLCWQPALDQFKFNISIPLDRVTLTKRKLLSELNRVFDPLGFLGPVLIKGKIFLQHLWQQKIDWDTPLQADIEEKWRKYYSGLELLKELCIHRKCKFQSGDQFEVHGFCDASIEAYGACIYIRSLDHQGTWQSRLLCSKTRVAPLKSTTIPRLELSGALLLAQLAAKVADSWSIKCETIHLWTDSMIVLGWLNSHSSRLKTFVANRVSQTLELTRSKQWHYIPTNENPADVLSRGTTAQELQEANGWWFGPHWLSKDTLSWRKEDDLEQIPEEALPELRTMQLSLVVVQHRNVLLDTHSEWEKLTRATAWILKFIEFLRLKKCMTKQVKYLTASDLKKAERWLIRCAQKDEFVAEFKALSIGKELPKNSKIRGLSPFISTDDLIVVGGRLHHSTLSNEQKHPIVLPFGHKVTRLIFIYYHEVLLHGGPQLLLSEVRIRFWPLKGRIIARSTTSRCVTCIRAKPKFESPIMATLPSARVRPARPFATTGVDFAGPLDVRSGIRRVTSIKTWIAVFVCLATRAIHLEPVVGLTSNAFFAALRRFMARRGKCSKIFSDNATNFVGVQRELATYLQGVNATIAKEGIDWHFNPPGAPHFGGIWESAVKSAKHHLTRVVKDAKLTLEELGTLLCQIEACLNSRPLTPLSSHPLDLEPITPAHFLIGGPLFLVPEADLSNENISTLRKWRYVQALMQTFWKRWSKEYLPQLQVRGRWLAQTEQVKIGDIVIIKEECAPPGKWRLGKILKIHPGSDGIVRVVTLKTSNGNELKRPVVKLCRLPVEEKDQNFENHNFQRGENVCAAVDSLDLDGRS